MLETVKTEKQLGRLLNGCVDGHTGIIRNLISYPPDSSKIKLAWTSAAIMSRSQLTQFSTSKRTGFGVGLTEEEATTKAVAEAIELYAATRVSEDDLIHSSIDDLSQDFLDPRQLGLYSRSQYHRIGFPYARLTRRTRITWTRGKWVDTGKAVSIPALLTYLGLDIERQEDFCQVTTNGLAAGRSLDDAALRAIFELIERDAFISTWLFQKPARRLIVDSALAPELRGIIRNLERRGMQVRLYVLDAVINVTVVLCIVLGDGKNWPGATAALGAHPDPLIATGKAILEQALVGPGLRWEMIAGTRRIPRRPENIAAPLDHALYYLPKSRARAFKFLESGERGRVLLSQLKPPKKFSLRACARILTAAGVRVAIKDVTPADVAAASPFRVVRALATNLQPIHFGFGLERVANHRLRAASRNGINPNPHPLA